MRNAFIKELITFAELDDRIVLVTGDLGFSVLEQFATRFPNRYINVGVAEQNMISIAAGLAHNGKIVFTYSIGNFATLRCLEQIRNDVCYHHANVKIVSVGAGFSYATQGYTHFALEDLAIMRALPYMNVFSPADPLETTMIVRQAIAIEGPCYLRLGKANETIIHDANFLSEEKSYPSIFPILNNSDNKKNILSTGSIAILLKDFILKNQLNYNLWSVPHIKPIDLNSLEKIINHSQAIYTVEEHQLSGGFGSAILEANEILNKQGRINHATTIKRIGIEDLIPPFIGSQTYMRERCVNFSVLDV